MRRCKSEPPSVGSSSRALWLIFLFPATRGGGTEINERVHAIVAAAFTFRRCGRSGKRIATAFCAQEWARSAGTDQEALALPETTARPEGLRAGIGGELRRKRVSVCSFEADASDDLVSVPRNGSDYIMDSRTAGRHAPFVGGALLIIYCGCSIFAAMLQLATDLTS